MSPPRAERAERGDAPTESPASLGWAIETLRSTSDTPRLDAEVLLGHVLGMNRAAVLARRGREELTPTQERAFREAVERRRKGEPVAYIVGEKEFFGLALRVDGRVLIPRPETETLVERALARVPKDGDGWVIADVGTGSGAIALAMAFHRPAARVYATDTSREALDVARGNAGRVLGAEGATGVRFVHGPLLAGIPVMVDVVCANLPYIPTGAREALPVPVRGYEPWSALDGGEDGLDEYRALLKELPERLSGRGAALMECDPAQAAPLLELALTALPGAAGAIVRDLAGDARVVEVSR